MNKSTRKLTALFGLTSVLLFAISFSFFSLLNSEFDILCDHISKLGSQGEPYAIYWNFIGFGAVGISLAAFGWFFGLAAEDRILGVCFVASGIGFAMAAAPADFANSASPLSKAHYVAICVSLAGWCIGLARLMQASSTDRFSRTVANYAVVLAILPILGISAGVSAEPVAHRLVLAVAFGWVALNSIQLLTSQAAPEFTS